MGSGLCVYFQIHNCIAIKVKEKVWINEIPIASEQN